MSGEELSGDESDLAAETDAAVDAAQRIIEEEDKTNERLIAIVASVAGVAFFLALFPFIAYAVKRYKIYQVNRVHNDPFGTDDVTHYRVANL